MFYENVLRLLIIMLGHCLQLHKLIVSWFPGFFDISWHVILCWINVSRMDSCISWFGALLCSLSIWRSENTVYLVWFQDMIGWSWSLSYNIRQSNNDVQIYESHYILHILILEVDKQRLCVPISNNSYIGELQVLYWCLIL